MDDLITYSFESIKAGPNRSDFLPLFFSLSLFELSCSNPEANVHRNRNLARDIHVDKSRVVSTAADRWHRSVPTQPSCEPFHADGFEILTF